MPDHPPHHRSDRSHLAPLLPLALVLLIGSSLGLLVLTEHLTPDATMTGLMLAAVTIGTGLFATALGWRSRTMRDNLLRDRERLEAILECIADAVVVAGTDGRIVWRNEASAALWPRMGGGIAHELHRCHDPATWHELHRHLADPKRIESHHVLKAGERYFEASWAPVSSQATAEPLGSVMVARDITERARAQRDGEQRERMATLGDLSTALAHEINNPLSSIQLYSQHALKSLAGSQPLTDHLETVLRNADACKRIVRDLLEYARQRPPERAPLPAGSMLKLAIDTIRPVAEAHGVHIGLSDEGLGTLVLADRDQVLQVLVNLALNGIEAMRALPPGAPRELTLACARRDKDTVELTVTDTAAGVPEADLAHIFRPFFTTRSDGTGLGLAVSSDIAHAHAGRLEHRRPPSGGATFALLLPSLEYSRRAPTIPAMPPDPHSEEKTP